MSTADYTDGDWSLLLGLAARLSATHPLRSDGPGLPWDMWPPKSPADEPFRFRPLGRASGRYSRGLYVPR